MFLAEMGKAMYDATYAYARTAPADNTKNPFLMSDTAAYNRLKAVFKTYLNRPEFQSFYREDAAFFAGKI